MLVEVLGRSRGAEGLHADEGAIGADECVPALANARLDGDLDRRLADDAGEGDNPLLNKVWVRADADANLPGPMQIWVPKLLFASCSRAARFTASPCAV